MGIEFGIIQDCGPLELIRFNIDGSAQWAIAGEQNNAFIPLGAFMFGTKPFRLLNVSDGMKGVVSSFDHPIVRYGMDYKIEADHAGPCCVNEGEYFALPGVIVSSESGTFPTFSSNDSRRTAYLDLATGKFRGEVGGARIAFGDWTLIHKSLGEEPVVLKRESKLANKG